MPEIDFTAIRPLADGQREGFEELSCQIFRQAPEAVADWRFQRNRGAGGDGGVEALWITPDGMKWGLQSKYLDTLGAPQKNQMKGSLDTALRNHPELRHYTFTLPFQLSGSAAAGTSRPREGSNETLVGWIEEWKAELAAEGVELKIDYWEETELSGRLQAMDPSGGRQRYWFDQTILTDEWFQRHLEDVTAQAGNRYTPELSVEVPLLGALEAFGIADSFMLQAQKIADELTRLQRSFSSMPDIKEGHKGWGGPPIPDGTEPLVQDIAARLQQVTEGLRAFFAEPDTPLGHQFFDEIASLIPLVNECETRLFDQLIDEHGQDADSPGFRQYSAEYQVSFPAANLDYARETIQALESLHTGEVGRQLLFAGSREMLVYGPAGIGKTHALIEHAWTRCGRNLRTVVLFGEDFSVDEPWKTIGTKLGLGAEIRRDELFAILEAAAAASGSKLILTIDALNETAPDRQRWQAWYPVLARQIGRSQGLKLLVSCRDTYMNETLPSLEQIPHQLHNGFAGREHEVVPRFFEHYELRPPGSPLFQSEFGNPLFLHLVCQSLKDYGRDTIPPGGGDFSDILQEFLIAKNNSIASDLGYHPGEDRVQTAVNSLARAMNDQSSQRLGMGDAQQAMATAYSDADAASRLFDALEKESIIAVLPEGPAQLGQSPNYVVRFTFERMTDHMRAVSYLSEVATADVNALFSQEGMLSFTVADKDAVARNRGLLEALSILLPEHHQMELPDAVDAPDLTTDLNEIVLGSLEWRLPESFTASTEAILDSAFRRPITNPRAVDALLSVSVRPDHPLNSDYLDQRLRADPLSVRDAYWPLALHELFEEGGKPKLLIDWALVSSLKQLDEESARLWAMTLTWFCSAADRRVRDRATKAIVRIGCSQPRILAELVAKFGACDDDYIRERVLVATYGVLILIRDPEIIGEVANEVWEHYFKEAALTTLHASIRDHARLILELASDLGVSPPEAQQEVYRPPYESDWPLEFPSQKEVQPFIDDEESFPRPMVMDVRIGMAVGTDFARYQIDTHLLDRFEDQEGNLDRSGVLRWFLNSAVEDLDYPCQMGLGAYYDHQMIQKYGSGRGRAGWAERIGKKYYWILLHRLLGRVADHLPRLDRWGDLRETEEPPIQALDLRDIDPTDLRAYRSKSYDLDTSDWFIGAPHDFSQTITDDHAAWTLASDLQDATGALIVRDPVGGEEWVVLYSHSDWTDPPEDEREHEYPYRRVGRGVWTATVANENQTQLHAGLEKVEYNPNTHGLVPHDYSGYIAEYPREFAYRQRFDSGDVYDEITLCGVSVRPTSIEHLKGGEWEYDYSQPRESSKNLVAPFRDIILHGELTWDGDRGWLRSDGSLTAINLVDQDERRALVVRKSYLDDFLAQNNRTLVFAVFQQKIVVTGGGEPGSYYDRWSVYELGNGVVTRLGFKDIKGPP